ncbi:FtsX-like permease family protein [Palleronia caenipelagi]|uniref:ABC transporter permease n=1 Tax=Palleronia caenipelagi TaxID=2489174 RepID=A0A547PUD4_9RHOB|nr:FtsX-like permease family protein [Palleronia caenipelagi]TRD17749.1 ABC transporter permease [Palleronia caenipelagi]
MAALGWKEFIRAFSRRSPGGRDFFWLATLLCLLQILMLVLLSARQGVLERSVDAFLGNQPGYGIPVWTRPNTVGFGGATLISEALVEKIEADGIAAEPFRRIFGRDHFAMPGAGVWRSLAGESDEDTFVGIAADFDGPLFPVIRLPPAPTAFGVLADELWTIVLDIDQFERHFDLAAYRDSVEGRIPDTSFNEIPEETAGLTRMPMIWLSMSTPKGSRLTPFRVVWARYLGVGSRNYAYLIERRWYVGISAQHENPALCSDLTGGPGLLPGVNAVQGPRLLTMQPADQDDARAKFDAALTPIKAEFGGEIIHSTTRSFWQPESRSRQSACPPLIPANTLALYLSDAGLTPINGRVAQAADEVELASLPATLGLELRGNGFSAPCDLLDDVVKSDSGTALREVDGVCMADVSATPGGRGYNEMLLFAAERTEIDALRDVINCADVSLGDVDSNASTEALCYAVQTPQDETVVQSRLRLSETYQDSLQRLAFLTNLFAVVTKPIGWTLFALLLAILWVQIGTLIGHRRNDYALLLASGFSPRQLTAMVSMQLVLAALFSMVVALLLFIGLREFLLNQSTALSTDFEKIVLGRRIDLLPLSIWDVAQTLGLVLWASSTLAWWQMLRTGVADGRSLEELMK